MKKIITAGLFFTMLFFTVAYTSTAQNTNAVDMFKNHINKVVQKVKEAKEPKRKRKLMNESFDKMLTAFDKVEDMKLLSETDQTALNKLKKNIVAKKNELNGLDGYQRISDSQLNNFANFTQQDLEQADSTITISVTVLLLIIIILILL